jgi:hypothetical protein
MNLWTKTVLKPPYSKRWRDCRGTADFAKRLECGAFTAAFGQPRRLIGSGAQGAKFLFWGILDSNFVGGEGEKAEASSCALCQSGIAKIVVTRN